MLNWAFVAPLLTGALLGLAFTLWGIVVFRQGLLRAREDADAVLSEARREAESRANEILVGAQEKALASSEEADRREREIEERESQFETRARQLEREGSEQGHQRKLLERRKAELDGLEQSARTAERLAREHEQAAQGNLERIAAMTTAEARAELVASIESEARSEATRLARRIEDEARLGAERAARNLVLQAMQRVSLREVLESTVSFIQLPNDEMKGRIIGKEGRNIRALEMATGIDLIVDDTPRSIWISSFDPIRREMARVALDRLLQDGRIHPARIEEVVQQVSQELESIIDEKGHEAIFSLGFADVHPKLVRLVGRMRYHIVHGQNLLQHAIETALVAGFMAEELGGRADIAQRAGLLHEIGQVVAAPTGHSILTAAELCAKYGESQPVVEAVRSLHPDAQPAGLEALLLDTANRISESRPGARKENLAVFIERLRRLETLALSFPGVRRAYAVKAGRELRVIIDSAETRDETAYALSKQIARAVERELSFSGQIKVSVVRESRAVRFAV